MKGKSKFIGWKRTNGLKQFFLFGKAIYSDYKGFMLSASRQFEENMQRQFLALKNIYIPAAKAHQNVFSKYHNCHKGKDMVLVAAGPTLDLYTPIPGAIHMGVNRTFQARQLELDYLVALDNPGKEISEQIILYRPAMCTKFFGYNYNPAHRISNSLGEAVSAERFYYEFLENPSYSLSLPYSLSHSPLIVMESTVIAAMQIALWMGPKRIYLVGCDCSTDGYFSSEKSDIPQALVPDKLIMSWDIIKQYVQQVYPDTEIISINPVGLKGMFTDATMADGKLELLSPGQ